MCKLTSSSHGGECAEPCASSTMAELEAVSRRQLRDIAQKGMSGVGLLRSPLSMSGKAMIPHIASRTDGAMLILHR